MSERPWQLEPDSVTTRQERNSTTTVSEFFRIENMKIVAVLYVVVFNLIDKYQHFGKLDGSFFWV
jgi:hypothetical protein